MYIKDVGSTRKETSPQAEGDTSDRSSLKGIICPNPTCPDAGQSDNIIKFGRTRQAIQRYRCKTCGTTFTATRSTIFYRRRTSHQSIMETLALLAEGVPVSSVIRAKRIKADTVRDWLNDAARHREAVEAELQTEFRLSREQIDRLWAHLQQNGDEQENGNRRD